MRSLVIIFCAAVALWMSGPRASAQLSPELRELGAELDALAAEIRLIEDLNTLQLTDAQLQQLIPATQELHATAIAAEQERVAILTRLKPLLEQRRQHALRDEPVPDELSDQIGELEDQLGQLDAQLDERLAPHAVVFREILSEPQISIITGEEAARRQVVELIEWVRELDDEAFEAEVPPYAAELADPEGDLGEAEIIDLLAVARAMSPEQYERAGEDIRGKLIELFRPTHETADRMIVGLFLHEAMPRVLQDMLDVAG